VGLCAGLLLCRGEVAPVSSYQAGVYQAPHKDDLLMEFEAYFKSASATIGRAQKHNPTLNRSASVLNAHAGPPPAYPRNDGLGSPRAGAVSALSSGTTGNDRHYAAAAPRVARQHEAASA